MLKLSSYLGETYLENVKKAERKKYESLINKRVKTSEYWKMICFLTDGELVRLLFFIRCKSKKFC